MTLNNKIYSLNPFIPTDDVNINNCQINYVDDVIDDDDDEDDGSGSGGDSGGVGGGVGGGDGGGSRSGGGGDCGHHLHLHITFNHAPKSR